MSTTFDSLLNSERQRRQLIREARVKLQQKEQRQNARLKHSTARPPRHINREKAKSKQYPSGSYVHGASFDLLYKCMVCV